MTRDLSTPIPNSYWVQPGRLLAGEYPGSMSRADAMERVQRLLAAGVTSFIDLTEEGELPEYETLLPELTERRVRYRRLAMLDHSVPDSAAHMARILDLIDGELAAGQCVYLHCRAGIGRTGTAVGCHLDSQRLVERARPTIGCKCCGSNARVRAAGRRFRKPPSRSTSCCDGASRGAGAAAQLDFAPRYEGALVGLALGDALGMLVAQSKFDASTLVAAMRERSSLRTGAHTAMTRALAESLLALCAHNPEDQMQRYLQWTRSADVVGARRVEARARRLAMVAETERRHARSEESRSAFAAAHACRGALPARRSAARDRHRR